MAKIKSCCDLGQSRKLAEFLPLESADMCYEVGEDLDGYITKTIYTPLVHTPYNDNYIPCWSLAALLDVLPKIINNETLFIETSAALWHIGYRNIYTARADNPVDALWK